MSDLKFDEASHTYTLGGALIPSVSKVIEPMYDFRFVQPEALEAAAKRGTAIHRTVELYERHRLNEATLHPFLAACLAQWLDFKQTMQYVPTLLEQRVHSEKYGYAGTLDNAGTMGGAEMLLDIKSGGKYEAHKLQTAGYKEAAIERGLLTPASKRCSLYIDEDGWEVEYHINDGGDRAAFLSLLTIQKWREANVRRK